MASLFFHLKNVTIAITFSNPIKMVCFRHRQNSTSPKNKNKKKNSIFKTKFNKPDVQTSNPEKNRFFGIFDLKKKKELDAITLVHCKRQRPAFVFARNSREFQFQIFEENNKRLPSYCTHTHSKQTY